ncbi:MAG: ABC transporter substrate-binding protein [Hyphomicrobiales bacterium]|nr:ABC transporter substrate-binding protein [Hyphomicrobiales bacterium]
MPGLIRTLALAAALAFMGAIGAPAQERTLYVAGYGGSTEQTIRKEIMPAFTKRFGGTVEYIAGNSTDTVAKLQAQRGNQQIDVAIVDDGPMYQAIALGFCAPIAGLPDADIVKAARYKDDKAVGIGLVATGLMYNSKYFAARGWAAPISWNDLKDPKYRYLLILHPLSSTYGLHTLLMMARLNGGGEANVDPGFNVIENDIAPNVLAFEPSPGKMTELFESGQGVIAVWGSSRVASFAQTGFPVDFVYPKEGALALLASACPVAKPNASPLAQEFVKMLIEPRIQEILAEQHGFGPVNRRAQVSPAAARVAPIGKRAEELIVVDWDTINQKRAEWNKRWTREVER